VKKQMLAFSLTTVLLAAPALAHMQPDQLETQDVSSQVLDVQAQPMEVAFSSQEGVLRKQSLQALRQAHDVFARVHEECRRGWQAAGLPDVDDWWDAYSQDMKEGFKAMEMVPTAAILYATAMTRVTAVSMRVLCAYAVEKFQTAKQALVDAGQAATAEQVVRRVVDMELLEFDRLSWHLRANCFPNTLPYVERILSKARHDLPQAINEHSVRLCWQEVPAPAAGTEAGELSTEQSGSIIEQNCLFMLMLLNKIVLPELMQTPWCADEWKQVSFPADSNFSYEPFAQVLWTRFQSGIQAHREALKLCPERYLQQLDAASRTVIQDVAELLPAAAPDRQEVVVKAICEEPVDAIIELVHNLIATRALVDVVYDCVASSVGITPATPAAMPTKAG